MSFTTSFMYPWIGRGRVSIVITSINDEQYAVGYAFCSPKDRFVRHRGRAIAQGRAVLEVKTNDQRYAFTIQRALDETAREFNKRIVAHVACDPNAPGWVSR